MAEEKAAIIFANTDKCMGKSEKKARPAMIFHANCMTDKRQLKL